MCPGQPYKVIYMMTAFRCTSVSNVQLLPLAGLQMLRDGKARADAGVKMGLKKGNGSVGVDNGLAIKKRHHLVYTRLNTFVFILHLWKQSDAMVSIIFLCPN